MRGRGSCNYPVRSRLPPPPPIRTFPWMMTTWSRRLRRRLRLPRRQARGSKHLRRPDRASAGARRRLAVRSRLPLRRLRACRLSSPQQTPPTSPQPVQRPIRMKSPPASGVDAAKYSTTGRSWKNIYTESIWTGTSLGRSLRRLPKRASGPGALEWAHSRSVIS